MGSDPGPVERELDELIIGESVVYKAVNNTDALLPAVFIQNGVRMCGEA